MRPPQLTVIPVLLAMSAGPAAGQLDDLPGYDRYRMVSDRIQELATGGTVERVVWSEDGAAVFYDRDDIRYRLDLETATVVEAPDAPLPDTDDRSRGRRRVRRGGQRDEIASPDGAWVARCRDYDVVIEPAADSDSPEVEVTTGGERKFRYGMASWVYGEELDQNEAMWWSPDSSMLVFYEFDEREVADFHLVGGWTELNTKTMTEGYPKPGRPNPKARLLAYHLADGETTVIDVGDDPEQYVYNVRFRPDGSELLFSRTNRRQNVLEVLAADPRTGQSRVVVREQQEAWQENRPVMRFLEDGERFVWVTERTGFKQFELRSLDGSLLRPLTRGDYPVGRIERIDEDADVLFYTAYSDANPLNAQLHRIGLDGEGQTRLTREPLNHRISLSPDARWFLTRYQSVETPPATAVYSTSGDRVATIAESDLAVFDELGLETPELFSFKADDGVTRLYGTMYKPSDFDPARTYPLVVSVYGGPLSRSVRNQFRGADPWCELGFITVEMDNRGTTGRGKAFETATYMRLGDVDIKDQADGVRWLTQRPYVDDTRVGIKGHSYGGYMAALAVLKFPEVFHVAVAGSAVTDWRNYDSVYTERFMRTPEENPEGYDEGSCLTYADDLTGHLLLLHGMIDNNVHPTNAWQLIDRLQRAKKAHDVEFYPNNGHRLARDAYTLQWRYLHQHLIGDATISSRSEPATDEGS